MMVQNLIDLGVTVTLFLSALTLLGAIQASLLRRQQTREQLLGRLAAPHVQPLVICYGDDTHGRHLVHHDQATFDVEHGWQCLTARVRTDLARQVRAPKEAA